MAIPSPISTTLISPKSITLIIALFFLIFSSSSYSATHKHTFRGFVVEKKARLGSRPPSCHNKCNECHPCRAVQVPALPRRGHRVDPSSSAQENYHSSSAGEMYSNYKPLGWKCRCSGRFYNP
ncbi:EPIDERMAL PATTERNING FACTOR-like protein 1 [Sesamum alatum]|uniref:Epidermal patterning factor-like protein n=1 Tax=Sesamum alatum TaxID=300844 RepID=A0AAE1YIR6_9LAMI|nr:EPIDERMAL PATTERNING FACTOR-like protein 1 [Sesamum alatum]